MKGRTSCTSPAAWADLHAGTKTRGVAAVADRITPEAVPLALVADPQLHPRRPLEPKGLFIDGQELTQNPNILALLVEMNPGTVLFVAKFRFPIS